MSNAYPVHPLIHEIHVDDVCKYLVDRGWIIRPFDQNEVIVFEGPLDDEGNPIVQLVPSSEDAPGFLLRMQELLNALAVIEERSAEQILRDIATQTTTEAVSDESAYYTFDATVLPIVFDEVEARRPTVKERWDKETLSRSLNRVREYYDAVVWPSEYDRNTLLVVAAAITVELAGVFESAELLEAVSLRILRMWRTNCRASTEEELESLVACANQGQEHELCELFLRKMSKPTAITRRIKTKSQKAKSRKTS
jgi:hypothetical protein